ncbi:MAG: hypothetical protein ACREYE_31110 [Gammaproteobacteria bacterium]
MRIKAHAVFFAFFLAIVPASFAFAFDVYIETNYRNQPDLSQYGAKNLRMIYAQNFWSKGQDRQLLPSKDRVINYVANGYNGIGHKDYTRPLVLDLEHWSLGGGSDAQVASRVEKLITVLEWVKSAAPKAKVGYYGTVPTSGYWPTQQPSSDPRYKSWQTKNDRAQALADRVDAFFPSLYPVSANQAAWVRYAVGAANEAKRVGNGKPIYIYINPRYHSNADDGLAFQTVPKDFIALQLKTIKQVGAAGVVIWGANNAGNQWNENLPWWQATKEFLGS